MRQSERFFWYGVACAWAATACGGLDATKFFPAPTEPAEAGAAGYSYDPGPSGGRSATAPRPNSAAGGSGAFTAFGSGGTSAGPADESGGGADDGTRSGIGGRVAGSGRGGASAGSSHGGHGGAGNRTTAGGGGLGGSSGAASAVSGSAGEPAALARDLLFSEYVEAGADKALEILSLSATNLRGCVIAIYSNGSTDDNTLKLDGPVGAGQVYTLCSSTLAPKAHCDRTTRLGFDGNDAIALVCDGTTLDVIGQIGDDPGDGWESDGDGTAGAGAAGAAGASAAGASGTGPSVTTADRTLRRRCGIAVGDPDGTDEFDPSAQWVALPADTVSGLGDPTCG